jgi:molybdopterin molybdotransferase
LREDHDRFTMPPPAHQSWCRKSLRDRGQTDTGKGWHTLPAGLLRTGDTNRRKLGEDLMEGQPALPKQKESYYARCSCASLGTEKTHRVAQAAWPGNEILMDKETPREGAVFDSNRYTVFGLSPAAGR